MTATYDLPPANRRIAFATQVVPAAAYAGVIFYGGLIRMGELPEVGFVATDKLLHALVFGGLALLLARALHWSKPSGSTTKKLVVGGLGALLMGLLLELCQAFVPYRSADPWDWVADSVGAGLAVGVAFLLVLWLPRRADG